MDIRRSPRLQTRQGFEAQFATNFLGHALLSLLLLPRLRQHGGRIVNVGSAAAWGGRFVPELFVPHAEAGGMPGRGRKGPQALAHPPPRILALLRSPRTTADTRRTAIPSRPT